MNKAEYYAMKACEHIKSVKDSAATDFERIIPNIEKWVLDNALKGKFEVSISLNDGRLWGYDLTNKYYADYMLTYMGKLGFKVKIPQDFDNLGFIAKVTISWG